MIKINLTAGLLQSLLGIMVFVAGTSAYQSGCSSRKKVEVGLPQPATDLRTPAYLLKKADVLEKATR